MQTVEKADPTITLREIDADNLSAVLIMVLDILKRISY